MAREEKTKLMKVPTESSEAKLTRIGKLKDAMEHAQTAIAEMASLLSDDLPPPIMARAYHVLNYGWKKDIERMQKTANEGIKEWVVENAAGLGSMDRTDSGGDVWKIPLDSGKDKFEAIVTESVSSQPDLELLAAQLLANRKARKPDSSATLQKCKDDLTVEQISRVYSADNVAELVRKGVLSQKDVDACKKKGSRSLKVNKL